MKILNQRDKPKGRFFWFVLAHKLNQRDGSSGLFWRVNQRDGFGLQKKKCSRSPQPAAFQRRIKIMVVMGNTYTHLSKQTDVSMNIYNFLMIPKILNQ